MIVFETYMGRNLFLFGLVLVFSAYVEGSPCREAVNGHQVKVFLPWDRDSISF